MANPRRGETKEIAGNKNEHSAVSVLGPLMFDQPLSVVELARPSPKYLHDGGAFQETQGTSRGQGEGREVVLC